MPAEQLPVFTYPLDGVLKCFKCDSKFQDHKTWKAHITKHHGVLDCTYCCSKCGAEYKAVNGVSSHYFYCKNKPLGVPVSSQDSAVPKMSFECRYCNGSWPTKIGLGVHKSSKHPMEWNRENEVAAVSSYSVFSEEELHLLAKSEASLVSNGVRFVNIELQKLYPHRSAESIKGKRRDPVYKDLVVHYASILEECTSSVDSSDTDSEDSDSGLATSVDPGETRAVLAPGGSQNEDDKDPDPGDSASPGARVSFGISTPEPATQDNNQVTDTGEENSIKTIFGFLKSHGFHDEQLDKKLSNILASLSMGTDRPELLGKLDEYLCEGAQKEQKKGGNKKDDPSPLPKTQPRKLPKRRLNKHQKFKSMQSLFHKNRRRLADQLFEKEVDVNESPSVEDIDQTYGRMFASESPEDKASFLRIPCKSRIYYPVSCPEIESALAGPGGKSAGPDALSHSDCKRMGIENLSILFNLFLFCQDIPSTLKNSRTTLIPKKGDLKEAKNWRPITVSSILLRVFHKVLSRRLAKVVDLHPAQQAFIPQDGCNTNTALLDHCIKEARKKHKNLCVASLDLAKAFDMVSHHSVLRALKRLDVDGEFIDYIRNSYQNSYTDLTCMGKQVKGVRVRRGVKQGDPLSPLLFNCIMDELFYKLPTIIGYKVGETLINVLAFADDLVLISSSEAGMCRLLEHTEAFLLERGLKLNPGKCTALSLKKLGKSKKLIFGSMPTFKISGQYLSMLSYENMLTYLGIQYDPKGKVKLNINGELEHLLKLLAAAPLKPHQKVSMLKQFLIPRFSHTLMLSFITKKLLREFDSKVRFFLRRILHLPHYSPISFFYLPVRDGGLGVQSVATHIPLAILKRNDSLGTSNNPAARSLSTLPYSYLLRRKMFSILGADTSKSLALTNLKSKYFSSANGAGLQHCNTKPSNHWIDNHWSDGRRYVEYVKLRTNLLPCRGSVANRSGRLCRFNCGKVESLSHISQGCPVTHLERVVRHNKVADFLQAALVSKGLDVLKEPRFYTPLGARKPDLLIVEPRRVTIVDVAIPWDTPLSVEDRFREKVSFYSHPDFLAQVRKRWPDKEVKVTAFCITARGAWCRLNEEICKNYRLNEHFKNTCVLRTMDFTISLYRKFMRVVT